MAMTGLEADTGDAYRRFGEQEARGHSAVYEHVCAAICEDAEFLALITELPAAKRQPNLVLGAAKYLGAPLEDGDAAAGAARWPVLRSWYLEHWAEVVEVVMSHATQTNEVGRCATVLPFVAEAAAGRPIALAEVGCSAGLAVYPDLYRYRYTTEDGDIVLGEGAPELTCAVRCADVRADVGLPPLPAEFPPIAWRGGLDVNPLDVTDPDDVRWLEALVWPGQTERLERLREAAQRVGEHARHDAPHIVRGDLLADLDRLVAAVPEDLPLLLFHSAVLAYADEATRTEFEQRMIELRSRAAGFTWISNEAASVMPGVAARLDERGILTPAQRFVISVDGEPRAFSFAHGAGLEALPQ